MTDKLIEPITRDDERDLTADHADELALKEADAEVIKAAEALAVCTCHVLNLDREAGVSSTAHNMAHDALDTFRRAMQGRIDQGEQR